MKEISMARRADEDGSHPLDIALGSRVRLRRKQLGLSQNDLAQACGITFQQVQKYEHGTNRISFSRLAEISHALDCSIADLIGNLDKSKSSAAFSRQIGHLAQPGASDLLHAYAKIESAQRRRAVLNLARQLAADQSQIETPSARDKAIGGAVLRRRAVRV